MAQSTIEPLCDPAQKRGSPSERPSRHSAGRRRRVVHRRVGERASCGGLVVSIAITKAETARSVSALLCVLRLACQRGVESSRYVTIAAPTNTISQRSLFMTPPGAYGHEAIDLCFIMPTTLRALSASACVIQHTAAHAMGSAAAACGKWQHVFTPVGC
jgi:hypothetical protein